MDYESNKSDRVGTILSRIISISLIVCSLICVGFCIIHKHLYLATLMPLVALFIFTIGKTNRRIISNMALVIINFSMMLRYGLYPVVMLINRNIGLTYADDAEAIFLLIYELFGIYAVIAIKGKSLAKGKLVDNERSYESYLGIITLLLILFMIPACIISPSLLRQFSLSSDTIKKADESTAGFIVSFFSMGIWTLMTFVLGSLGTITKKNNSVVRGLGLFLAFGISLLYLLSRVINGTNVKRWGIISTGIVAATILIRTFPNKRKQITSVATIGIVVGVIVGSFVKFNESYTVISFLNKHGSFTSIDAYFAGIKGLRDGLEAIRGNPLASTLRSTLTDLFSGVPIVSRLFNANVDSIPVMYLAHVRRTDLICPLIVQSIAHFGYIGAPILSMVMTYLALTFNEHLIKTKNLYETFVCVELTFYLSLVMELNTLIILGVVWVRLIYLLMLKFDRKVTVNQRG